MLNLAYKQAKSEQTELSESNLPTKNIDKLRKEYRPSNKTLDQSLDIKDKANISLGKFGWKVIDQLFGKIEDPNIKVSPDAEYLSNIRPQGTEKSFPFSQAQFNKDGDIVGLIVGSVMLKQDNLKYAQHIMRSAKEGAPVLGGKLPDGRAFVLVNQRLPGDTTKMSALVFDKDDPSKFTQYETDVDIPTTFGQPGDKKIEFVSKEGAKLTMECTINSQDDMQNGAPYYSNVKIGLSGATAVTLSTFEPE
jgi:hypothetical protein